MAEGHKWRPLSDLPANPGEWEDHELDSLAHVWRLRKGALEGQEMIVAFNRELEREWAIETGIIEGVYTLDRGITQTLIERGIDASYIPHEATNRDPELVARIIQGHKEALEGIFAFVKGERELGTSYIKELHVALLPYVDRIVVFDQFGKSFETKLEKGEYKKLSNNPRREDGTIHEYCPPEHVASEMDRLIDLHREHRRRSVASHIEAAWLHHAFTQIHPFQDGNGRVARALASLVFIHAALFPLVVTRDDRTRYIDALEVGDARDLGPLVRLFAELQRKMLRKGIARAIDSKPVTTVEGALAVTREMLAGVGLSPSPVRWENYSTPITREILNHTATELRKVAEQLNNDVGQGGNFRFIASGFGEPSSDGGMRADLYLRGAGRSGRIVVTIPVVDSLYASVSIVADFLRDDGEMIPLSIGSFDLDFSKSPSLVLETYAKWLDEVMIRGLAEWRRTLV